MQSIRKTYLPTFLLIALWLVVASLPAGAATKFKRLYSFKGGSDGSFPTGALISDSSGNLYGTTYAGGNTGKQCSGSEGTGCGTVFMLSPMQNGAWKEATLYRFKGGADGESPNGNMIFDPAGDLYGTTAVGGQGISYGCGTVFKLAPGAGKWKESIAYTFCSEGGDGYFPNPGMIMDSSGNLYGTTLSGGSALGGIVFELTNSGKGFSDKALYDFCLVDSCFANGSNPAAGLITESHGNFYGTTGQGGAYMDSCGGFPGGCGVVYELTNDSKGNWTQTVIHNFQGPSGTQPSARVTFDGNGNLYGTTNSDGAFGFGTAFELTPSGHGQWTYHVLYNFREGIGGGLGNAVSGLVMDASGNLYGAIGGGGTGSCSGYGCGLVYKLSPGKHGRWDFTTLHSFTGNEDGGQPTGDLILDSHGNLYGTASVGGSTSAGVVFEITP